MIAFVMAMVASANDCINFNKGSAGLPIFAIVMPSTTENMTNPNTFEPSTVFMS